MSSPQRQSDWLREDKAVTFVEDRRGLIPLIEDQEWVCRALLERGRRVETFLDVGCGAGAMSALVLDGFPDAKGTLVDFSEPMLQQAKKSFGSGHRVLFGDLTGPAWKQEIESDRFDVAVSGLAIHHLADWRKQRLFSEIYELLEPGGLFINLEHVAAGELAVNIFDEVFVERITTQAREHGKDPERVVAMYKDTAQEEDILATPIDQCRWLEEAGFEAADQYFRWLELAVIAARKPEGSN